MQISLKFEIEYKSIFNGSYDLMKIRQKYIVGKFYGFIKAKKNINITDTN